MKFEKYTIEAQDEYNIRLGQDVEKKAAFGKEPKEGDTSNKFIGYYSSLGDVIKKIINLELKSQINTNTLESILEAIYELETRIDSTFGHIKHCKDLKERE